MSSVISVIITAFVTGALARFAVPGPDPMPAWLTILIELLGGAMLVVEAPRSLRANSYNGFETSISGRLPHG